MDITRVITWSGTEQVHKPAACKLGVEETGEKKGKADVLWHIVSNNLERRGEKLTLPREINNSFPPITLDIERERERDTFSLRHLNDRMDHRGITVYVYVIVPCLQFPLFTVFNALNRC